MRLFKHIKCFFYGHLARKIKMVKIDKCYEGENKTYVMQYWYTCVRCGKKVVSKC